MTSEYIGASNALTLKEHKGHITGGKFSNLYQENALLIDSGIQTCYSGQRIQFVLLLGPGQKSCSWLIVYTTWKNNIVSGPPFAKQ